MNKRRHPFRFQISRQLCQFCGRPRNIPIRSQCLIDQRFIIDNPTRGNSAWKVIIYAVHRKVLHYATQLFTDCHALALEGRIQNVINRLQHVLKISEFWKIPEHQIGAVSRRSALQSRFKIVIIGIDNERFYHIDIGIFHLKCVHDFFEIFCARARLAKIDFEIGYRIAALITAGRRAENRHAGERRRR